MIFGSGPYASLVHDYLSNGSGIKVAGFTVNREYMSDSKCCGLELLPFEEIETHFPPSDFEMLVAVGYSQMNRIRAEKCLEAKNKGYRLSSFIHPSNVQWPGMIIGENCIILENNVFQAHSKIGNNVCVWAGSVISHHVELKDNVFVAPGAVIAGNVQVGENCFIGANATIRNGVKIGKNCVIGAGAVILDDTHEEGVYVAPHAQKLSIKSLGLNSL